MGLEARKSPEPVDIDVEFLEVEQLPNREGRDKWVELLRMKYADSAPQMLSSRWVAAITDCVAMEQPNLFPKAAFVYCSVSAQTLSGFPMTDRMTGVAYRFDFRGTLEVARRLFPATRSMIVVSGSSTKIWPSSRQPAHPFAQDAVGSPTGQDCLPRNFAQESVASPGWNRHNHPLACAESRRIRIGLNARHWTKHRRSGE